MQFVKTELTQDMKNFTDSVCNSLSDQKARGHDYKEAAHMIAKKFLSANSPQSAFTKLEKAILDYMIEAGHVTASVLNSGYVDENGIEVVSLDEQIPRELSSRKYGCLIAFNNEETEDELTEMLIDADFIKVSAYKLVEHGVLSNRKKVFFAHPKDDCAEWAREVVEIDPQVKVGNTFHVNWLTYYDIEVTTDKSSKLLKYHKLHT